jgi:glycosyltransferase involved in cell wall biosynthesis
MTSKPFFSLIIPALNEEVDLPILLQDILKQSIDDYEVILIDGRSEDKTMERSKPFQTRLPLTILSSDIRNVSVQRNMGAKHAKGKYLLFNDADNRLPKYFLEGVRYQMRVKPVDVFTTWFLPDTNLPKDQAVATFYNLQIEAMNQLGTPGGVGAMIGCKRNLYKSIGGFNPEVGFAEDTDFIRTAYNKGYSFTVLHEPRFVYSLRRFRRDGLLRSLQNYAILNLKYMTKQKVNQVEEYPMGGKVPTGNSQSAKFMIQFDKLFKKLVKTPKAFKRIKALLSIEDQPSK